jgi:metacaspase-1
MTNLLKATAVSTTPGNDAQNALSIEIKAAGTGVMPGVPSISAPSSILNSPTPPRFQVNPGPGRCWVVEVAFDRNLFNFAAAGNQRADDNLFGSWKTTPFPTSATYPVSYDLPGPVWERLRRNATALYYRLWATDSPNGWVNQVSTVSDQNAANAPSILIAREVTAEQPGVAMAAASAPTY